MKFKNRNRRKRSPLTQRVKPFWAVSGRGAECASDACVIMMQN